MATIASRKLPKHIQIASIFSKAMRILTKAVTDQVLSKQLMLINMLVRSNKTTDALSLEMMLAMLAAYVVISAGDKNVVSNKCARL